MKYLIDTNVLISAFVFGGKSAQILRMLFETRAKLYVSQYVDDEFRAKLEEKWPDKADRVYELYRKLDFIFVESTSEKLGELRDEKDIPVLSDALYHGIDVIISGDKDFSEAGLTRPLVFTPAMLLDFLMNDN